METANFLYDGEVVTIQLTDEFVKALNILEQTNSNLFITGKAGVGKSMLLKYFRSKTLKNVVVLSFTGLAAINVNGQTIHSFFGFPLGLLDSSMIKHKDEFDELLKSIDMIIIDEISMCRADLIDAIDKSLRMHRSAYDKPFGGVQMVFIGDLLQLTPIVEKELAQVYSRYYKSPFFFHADVFNEFKLPMLSLEKIHRQNDPEFITILNNIRERKFLYSTLEKLNKLVRYNYEDVKNGETIILTTRNEKVREINNFFLNKLESQTYNYSAMVTGDFDAQSYPTDQVLSLKVGAKIIFIRNDPEKQYVNGDTGIIVSLENGIEVKTKRGRILVPRVKWEKTKYAYVKPPEPAEPDAKGKLERVVIGKFEQYPIKLAWALTVHKAQGSTYDDVLLDLQNSFTSGQVYVALSRCRSLQGLKLQTPININDVILDSRIEEIHKYVIPV